MNVLIAGGRKKADFLAKSLLSRGHNVTIIQDDETYCRYLARAHDTPVVCGDASKPHILEEAEIRKAEAVIAMTPSDADNLVICQLAGKMYGVKRVFATVNNPGNVDVFKRLGIDTTVSATYMVAGAIEQMAAMEKVSGYFPFQQGRVAMMEIAIRSQYPVAGKNLASIGFPEKAIVGCIIRGTDSFIPRGGTVIQAEDKLIVLSPPEIQKEVLRLVTGKSAS